jgi:alpha-glucosidase
MQWQSDVNAGFSNATPWLPLSDDFMHENVANLDADPLSILNLYKALIGLRRKWPPLVIGSYEPIAAGDDLLMYRRRSERASITVVLNLGADPVSLASDAIGLLQGEILLSTFMDRSGEKISGALDLRGNEGVLAIAPLSATE